MALCGFVCYCPELRLYWYKVSNEENPEQDADYKFNDDELEDAIATHLASKQDKEAEFMGHLTGLGRTNPHKIVSFDQDKDEIKVEDPADFWKRHDAERDGAEDT